MTVTFIGHSDAPQEIKEELKSKIEHLIKKENADIVIFYVKNHFSNAYQFLEYAQKTKKIIIEL